MAKTVMSKIRKRARVAFILVVLVGFGLGAFGLVNASIIHGAEYKQKAESQQLSDTTVTALRGTITDANGNIIAKSADVWKVWINPSKMKDDATRQNVAKNLSEILELEYDTVYEKCCRSTYAYVVIKSQVEYEAKTKVVEFARSNKGYTQFVSTEDDVKRYYPYSNFASSVLGFTGSDDIGRSGLEYYYDDTLTGTSGRIITAKNAKQVSISSDFETYYEAKSGLNLQLTIDQVIQYYLDSALEQAVIDNKATYGYGIIMDTKTGAILAMSTKPDFDCNNPYAISEETMAEINEAYTDELGNITDEDARSNAIVSARYAQWRNRTITDSYEPGSVFKCIVAAAALEENLVKVEDTFYCSGSTEVADRTYHCSKLEGHGSEDFPTAFKNSCNPVFIEIGQRLGASRYYKYFEAFGFTEKTGIDLPAESTPVANVTYYTANKLTKVSLASCSFGQSFQVSPIQVITAINAIANDGKLMQPYIVGAMLDNDGNKVYETEPTIKRQAISSNTAATVRSMMEEVVKTGGGKNAYVAGYRVAGKTGTSDKLTNVGYTIASFCGFAPADDPEITFLIVIDEPKGGLTHGGSVAAPVVAEVVAETMQYLNVEPQYTTEELAKLSVKTPSYIGKGAQTAKKELESQGFTVRVVGKGEEVANQYPTSGQMISKNGVVVLYTEKKTTEKAVVPNLTGLTVAEANKAAIAAGFNIKLAGYTNGNKIKSYRQNIAAGTEANLGSVITVSFKTSEALEGDD